MKEFLSGAAMLGFLASGLFFLKFWRQTEDRFFLIFSIAFSLLAFERVVLAMTSVELEGRIWMVYLIRLLAFILIIGGVIDKNRAAPPST